MSKKVFIIGAGGTGRGFIPRLLQEEGVAFDFADKDSILIEKLNAEKQYTIYTGEQSREVVVSGYTAYEMEDPEAVELAAQAEYVFTAVGEEHLPELVPFLSSTTQRKAAPVKVIVCENGVSPKRVLQTALKKSGVENCFVTQAVVFCTSIPKVRGELAIVSEDYPVLPVDTDEELFEVPYEKFPATRNFDQVLQRKIYTYNCLSACISYLGAYLGYTIYSDAANDPVVRSYCNALTTELNEALCMEMNLDAEDQKLFAERAIRKFANPMISDTILKNSRSVVRKLSPTERVMGPMKIMKKYGKDTKVLEIVAAAALIYYDKNEKIDPEPDMKIVERINPELDVRSLMAIGDYYEKLCKNEDLKSLL